MILSFFFSKKIPIPLLFPVMLFVISEEAFGTVIIAAIPPRWTQLNAGGLRLIRKQSVADSIAAYDLLWQRAEFWKDGYISLQRKGKDIVHKLVDYTSFLSKYKRPPTITLKSSPMVDSLPVKINIEYLNEFLGFADDQKIWTGQDKQAYEAIEKSAERLIALIKKEYNFQ